MQTKEELEQYLADVGDIRVLNFSCKDPLKGYHLHEHSYSARTDFLEGYHRVTKLQYQIREKYGFTQTRCPAWALTGPSSRAPARQKTVVVLFCNLMFRKSFVVL